MELPRQEFAFGPAGEFSRQGFIALGLTGSDRLDDSHLPGSSQQGTDAEADAESDDRRRDGHESDREQRVSRRSGRVEIRHLLRVGQEEDGERIELGRGQAHAHRGGDDQHRSHRRGDDGLPLGTSDDEVEEADEQEEGIAPPGGQQGAGDEGSPRPLVPEEHRCPYGDEEEDRDHSGVADDAA